MKREKEGEGGGKGFLFLIFLLSSFSFIHRFSRYEKRWMKIDDREKERSEITHPRDFQKRFFIIVLLFFLYSSLRELKNDIDDEIDDMRRKREKNPEGCVAIFDSFLSF